MLAHRDVHLRAGGRTHSLDPPARIRDQLLEPGGREDRDRDDTRRDPGRQPREGREEVHVSGDASAVVDEERLLAAGVDDHAGRRRERRHDGRQLALLRLELLERARADVLRDDPVDRDELDPQ